MRTTFRVVIWLGLVLLCSAANAQQPRRVLFETFTNSFDQCPMANGLDAAFKATLASANGSKVIHLNHHIINVGDPMVVAGGVASLLESYRLAGQKNYIFMGAVDHTIFDFENTRVTSQFTPNGSNEWNARINERVGELPLVSITLSDAKLDKIGQADYWRLIAKIKVTLQDDNTDSIRLFYAITEDGVNYKQCESTKPVVVTNHDNVVRFIDIHGVPLDLKNKNAGASTEVTISHDISKADSYEFKLANMKLIGFVERGTQATYEVVQSWELRKNFDTLAAPPPELSFVSTHDATYFPEQLVPISFDKTNIDSIKIEYSLNNGSTWIPIANANRSPYFWYAPSTVTTQGKIRISDLATGQTVAVSENNFSIQIPSKYIIIVKPSGGDTAFITKDFPIKWKKIGIDEVKLEYSTNGGNNWVFLKKTTDTSFVWKLFPASFYPPTEQALIRITEVSLTVPEPELFTTTSNQFYIMEANVGKVQSSKVISDIRLYPQPVEKNGMLTVEFMLADADKLEFALYDILGKQVYGEKGLQMSQGLQSHTLQLPSLSSGPYILTMSDSQGGRISKKVEIR